jgi:hypothetical protein
MVMILQKLAGHYQFSLNVKPTEYFRFLLDEGERIAVAGSAFAGEEERVSTGYWIS